MKNTKFYKGRDGWAAESMSETDANGKAYQITTFKVRGGVECTAIQGQDNGNMFSYDMFDAKRLKLASEAGQCNENKVKAVHAAGLIEFERIMKETAQDKPAFVLGVGQILFTDCNGDENRRVIYEVERPGRFKTVTLDGKQLRYDDHVKPYAEKFGIGTYYNEGETVPEDEIFLLVELATKNEARDEAAEEIKRKENEKKAAEKAEYLKQFTKADRRKTTNILKAHILKTFESVSKIEVKTDVFSMGDSMDVTYYAPSEIPELEEFIKTFQYGHFDGMNDMYEYNKESEEIIIDGHILETYKFVNARHKEAEAPAPREEKAEQLQVMPVSPGKVQIIEYNERAIAVIGDTKPIKDKLKELGGKFNFRLTCGPGWIFRMVDLERVKAALMQKEGAHV